MRLEALLELSKLTISFLKGHLAALCFCKLNCKQRVIKEWGYTYKFRTERACSFVNFAPACSLANQHVQFGQYKMQTGYKMQTRYKRQTAD